MESKQIKKQIIQDIDKESNVHVSWVEPVNDFLSTGTNNQ